MEKLSSLNEARRVFIYKGKTMPLEFADVCTVDRLQKDIENRTGKPWRYSDELNKFLKYNYTGNLPKNLYDLAHKLGKPDYICDLFYMNVDGYKNVHPKEYADFFDNQPQKEKELIFYAADCGARTLYEYIQDVKAGGLSEDMVAYHTKGILSPNENASGRGDKGISTSCDFIFRNPQREGKESIEQPIELKTKWGGKLKDVEIVKMRGTIDTILKEKGMVLAVYIKMNKAVLIDPIGKQYKMTPGKMANGKECVDIHIDKNDIIDFVFWKKEDIMKMMHMIWDQNHARETK